MNFDESYYTSGNYTNYLERGGRYLRLISEVNDFLECLHLNNPYLPTLDFGCAVGFCVKALKTIGYVLPYGYDISRWAIEYGTKQLGLETLTTDYENIMKRSYYLTFMLDVLEHIEINEVQRILNCLSTTLLIIRVPVCKNDGHEFVFDTSRKDHTHITKLSKGSWDRQLDAQGYQLLSKLNLNTIWDSEGVFCALYRKNVNFPPEELHAGSSLSNSRQFDIQF